MPTLEKMVDGFKIYKATVHEKEKNLISHQLRAGMKPTTLVITSSDFMVPPELLTGCNHGELYTIRLKAGLVPTYNPQRVSGFTATLEYAVTQLEVQNIVVLGHTYNDGLRTLLDGGHETTDSDPLKAWLGTAHEVYEAVKQHMGDAPRPDQERAMELETIVLCLRNLFSYPWLESRVNAGNLEIYGWHFDIEAGILLAYLPSENNFVPMG